MKTTNKTTTTRANQANQATKGIKLANGETISNNEFKRRSFTAYCTYVEFMEGKVEAKDAFKALCEFFVDYGFVLNVQNMASVLTISMASYGTLQGEKTRKIKSIGVFRKFVLGDWKTVSESKFVSRPGKAPASPKGKTSKTPKAKKPTKADLEAENEALKKQLEELKAANK